MKRLDLDIIKMIRPTCAGFQPYVAGKPVETIKRELGLKKVIKLASNENPLGPSPKALKAVAKALKNLYFYPDSNAYTLRRALAESCGVPPESIMVGAGSDELIVLLGQVFFRPADEIVISEHAFIRYHMAGKLMACGVKAVPMKGFTHDLAAMAKAVTPRTKAVFIANPNNPTGTYNTKAEFEAFLAALAKKCGAKAPLVVVDEAYYEYARELKDYPATLDYFKRYPNLVILRTFSKIYALAGLRVGYGIASPQVVDYIDRVRPPFNVNSLAQVAAVESLRDRAQVERSARLVREQKKYLYGELERLGVHYIPSAGNFFLMEAAPLTGVDLFKKLLALGVITRPMAEYDYPGHIRVSIGLPAENRTFIAALRKSLKK